jgi:hypothetical protein
MTAAENSWPILFRYKGEKRSFTVGDVNADDAEVYAASTDELLRLLKRNMIDIPVGCSIEDFMFHRASRPSKPPPLLRDGRR